MRRSIELPEELTWELESELKRYLARKAVGQYPLLQAICLKMECRRVTELLLQHPSKILEMLRQLYHDEDTVRFALRVLIFRPILLKLNMLDMEEELINLIYKDPEKFKSTILEKLASSS